MSFPCLPLIHIRLLFWQIAISKVSLRNTSKERRVSLKNTKTLSDSRFFLPTGTTKPPPSGSGKPVRFDRKPVKTGQIQISNYRWQFNRFPPVSRPVWPVNRSGLSGNRELNKKTDGKSTLVQNLNICITCFSLNEPSNPLLYYFYINTMYNMFCIVFVYFCMHAFFWV